MTCSAVPCDTQPSRTPPVAPYRAQPNHAGTRPGNPAQPAQPCRCPRPAKPRPAVPAMPSRTVPHPALPQRDSPCRAKPSPACRAHLTIPISRSDRSRTCRTRRASQVAIHRRRCRVRQHRSEYRTLDSERLLVTYVTFRSARHSMNCGRYRRSADRRCRDELCPHAFPLAVDLHELLRICLRQSAVKEQELSQRGHRARLVVEPASCADRCGP